MNLIEERSAFDIFIQFKICTTTSLHSASHLYTLSEHTESPENCNTMPSQRVSIIQQFSIDSITRAVINIPSSLPTQSMIVQMTVACLSSCVAVRARRAHSPRSPILLDPIAAMLMIFMQLQSSFGLVPSGSSSFSCSSCSNWLYLLR